MKHFWYVGFTLSALALAGCGDAGEPQIGGEEAVDSASSALTAAQRNALINAKRAANPWLGAAIGSSVQHTAGAHRVYEGNRRIYIGDSPGQAYILLGSIAERYFLKGAQNSPLGYPMSDEGAAQNGGAAQFFAGGYIYWQAGAAQAFEISGCSTWGYNSASFEVGPLGYLTSGQDPWFSQVRNTTEYGRVYYKNTGKGCIRDARVVFTAIRSNATYYGARLFASVEAANQTQSRLKVTGGSGFTPNSWLSIYVNDPTGQIELASQRPIDANGNLAGFYSVAVGHNLIKKINGVTSLLAVDSGGAFVSVPANAASNSGSEWLGDY